MMINWNGTIIGPNNSPFEVGPYTSHYSFFNLDPFCPSSPSRPSTYK